jgi:hypothetical protein
MTRKGKVSTVDEVNHTARVVFPDLDNAVSADIRYAKHVTLNVSDMVVVTFFSSNMSDGLIIAVF